MTQHNLDQLDDRNTKVLQLRLHEEGLEGVRYWLMNKSGKDRAYCSVLVRAYALDLLALAQELEDDKMAEVEELIRKVKAMTT
jgi:hypothetical protein